MFVTSGCERSLVLHSLPNRRTPQRRSDSRRESGRSSRLEVGDQADVEHLVAEVVLTTAQVLHVAVVDLFGGDLDGLVPVGLERVAPDVQRLDVVRPQ